MKRCYENCDVFFGFRVAGTLFLERKIAVECHKMSTFQCDQHYIQYTYCIGVYILCIRDVGESLLYCFVPVVSSLEHLDTVDRSDSNVRFWLMQGIKYLTNTSPNTGTSSE